MGVQGGVMDGTEPHATTAASSWDVMISYCWADAAWVLAMCEILRTEGNLRVWIDRDFMAGSTVAAMANAVKSSRVIVPCITPSYIKSANAMQELKFAFDLRKPIVPVRSGSNADIEGTEAAFMTATLLYTRVETEDLSHPSRLRAVALRLLKQILNAMGQAESPPLATNNSIGLSLGSYLCSSLAWGASPEEVNAIAPIESRKIDIGLRDKGYALPIATEVKNFNCYYFGFNFYKTSSYFLGPTMHRIFAATIAQHIAPQTPHYIVFLFKPQSYTSAGTPQRLSLCAASVRFIPPPGPPPVAGTLGLGGGGTADFGPAVAAFAEAFGVAGGVRPLDAEGDGVGAWSAAGNFGYHARMPGLILRGHTNGPGTKAFFDFVDPRAVTMNGFGY